MVEKKRTLPDYTLPPVIETVLGVQFSPLANFSVLHFGLYWEKVREEYPKYEIQPPLATAFEKFGSQFEKEPKLGIELSNAPPQFRCWFIDDSRTRLIQVQNDRFIINWRKITGEEKYPHYDTFRPRFEMEWKRFCQFLEAEEFSIPEIDQCEVTYVNHMEINDDIKYYGEIYQVFNTWSKLPPGSFLPEPEVARFSTKYVMPEERGRLHVDLAPKIRRRDGKEVLQLNLTARGKPNSSGLEDIITWFDLGHEWIVKGFTELTTTKMHKLWGRNIW